MQKLLINYKFNLKTKHFYNITKNFISLKNSKIKETINVTDNCFNVILY